MGRPANDRAGGGLVGEDRLAGGAGDRCLRLRLSRWDRKERFLLALSSPGAWHALASQVAGSARSAVAPAHCRRPSLPKFVGASAARNHCHDDDHSQRRERWQRYAEDGRLGDTQKETDDRDHGLARQAPVVQPSDRGRSTCLQHKYQAYGAGEITKPAAPSGRLTSRRNSGSFAASIAPPELRMATSWRQGSAAPMTGMRREPSSPVLTPPPGTSTAGSRRRSRP